MTVENEEPVWMFKLFVESRSGRPVSRQEAEDLFDHVLAWVEDHDLQMGGGFRPPDEARDYPSLDALLKAPTSSVRPGRMALTIGALLVAVAWCVRRCS